MTVEVSDLLSPPVVIVSSVGQQKLTLRFGDAPSDARILGRCVTLNSAIAILPAMAAMPGLLVSGSFDKLSTAKERAFTWIGSIVANGLISCGLQLVAISVSLLAAGLFNIAALAMRDASHTTYCRKMGHEFAKAAFVSFDLALLHLSAAVYPGWLQFQSV